MSQFNQVEYYDGIDMARCIIDKSNNKVEFAGANNPLYIIRKNELIEIHPDKMPVGIYKDPSKLVSFTNQIINVEKGDLLYMFSDGFADQFGGDKGKKFKYAPFKKLLAEIRQDSMRKQKEVLNDTFENWKGDLEQVDDVVMVGIKV